MSMVLARFYLPVLVFMLSSAIAVMFLDSRARQLHEQEARAMAQVLEESRSEFQENLSSVMYLASGVAAYIQANHGYIPTEQASSWLRNLRDYNPYVRNIGLAPNNRITFVYPLKGNEKVLGLDYVDLPEQWPRVQLAMQRHRPVIDAPVKLVQGGVGLIHRAPIFLDDGRYWGMVSTVMRLDAIMSGIRARAARQGVELQFLFEPQTRLERGHGSWHVIDMPVDDMKWQLAGRKPGIGHGGMDYVAVGVWSLVLLFTLTTFYLSAATWRQRMLQGSLNESLGLFREAFQNMPHGLLLLDRSGHIVEANPVMQNMLGRSAAVARGSLFREVVAPVHRASVDGLLAGPQDGKPRTVESELLIPPRGEAVPVEFSVVRLQHEQLGCLVFIRDIRDSRRLLQAQNEFVSTASHELRTPLTAIIGSLELMRSGVLGEFPPDMATMLEMAASNSDRLQKLINDLLDTNRLILGQMSLSIKPLDVAEVARTVLLSLQPIAARKHVRLLLETSGSVLALADEDRLAQVLVNLLANAIRFSHDAGQVIVRVRVVADFVHCSVQDFGRGIDPSFAPRAFTRFGQADSSDTREQGGTGLGLFICRGLVEQMHGRIGYESEPGRGAIFWFDLPLADTAGEKLPEGMLA